MATNTKVVTEAEKDQPGVTRQTASIPGIGDVDVYVLTEYVDDVTGKPGENTRTIRLRFPYEGEQEVEARDDEGNPIPNGDGTNKVTMESFIAYEVLDLDVSDPTFAKLTKAMEPYRAAGRPVPSKTLAPVRTRTTGGAEHKEWLSRVRAWLKSAGHEVADQGRISARFKALYVQNNASDPEPEK